MRPGSSAVWPRSFSRRFRRGGALTNVFREDSHDLGTARFVLHAINACENTWAGVRAARLCGQTCNRIEANRGKGFPFVGERDFETIRETRECHIEMRMSLGQVFERFKAGSEDGRLQLSDRIDFQAGYVSEVARRTTDRRSQTRIGVELHMETPRISCHGCWLRRRRRLPGNRDNSRDRRSKGVRCAGPCRWCSIFRKCNALRANHTARNLWELA